MENPFFIVTVGSLIIFVAFFIRSLTGFGSALVSIPFLALLFDLKFAVPLEAILEVGLSIMLMSRVYKSIRKKILIPLIIGTVIGSLLGTYILYSFSNIFLKNTLGIAIILFALNMLIGKTDRTVKPISSWWGVPAGGVGGVLGGLFGTSGPAFVMYLTYKIKTKEAFRASLIGLFAVDYSWRVGVYAATGLLTMETLKMALFFTPALILGTILGHKTHFRISPIRFKQAVAAVLLVSGIFLLIP
jgi:uncharacterized membrane protein YfcA